MMSDKLPLVLIAALALPLSLGSQQHSSAPQQDFALLLQAAEKARDEDRTDEAIQLFRRALSEQPESEEALWYLGTVLYEKEQFAEARDALRRFVTLRNDAAPGWALLGLCEFELREYRRALDHLQRASDQGIGERKELARPVLYDLIVLLNRFERYDESLALLAYGEEDPALIEPAGLAGLRLPVLPAELPQERREMVDLAGKGVLAMQAERYGEAEPAFKQLAATYPNEPGVHFLYGAFLMWRDPDNAVPEFQHELQISPFHVLARVRMAERLVAQQEFDGALELCQEALKLDPKRASAHAFAGEALIGKGDSAGGIKELEIARDADPSASRVHWDLMRAYVATGRKEDAAREKQEVEKRLRSKSVTLPQQPPSEPGK